MEYGERENRFRRLTTAAADRNKQPILEVLRRVLPARGLVCEIASGTGQHAVHFAAALPGLEWQPTDSDPDMLHSIEAWIAESPPGNIRPPLLLDVEEDKWPVESADAIVCINMIHIAPWQATMALMRGAGRILPAGGVLFLYGPYRRGGRHSAPSNDAFDADLKKQNPEWGVRDLEAVSDAARATGLVLIDTFEMPANNLSVIFRRTA